MRFQVHNANTWCKLSNNVTWPVISFECIKVKKVLNIDSFHNSSTTNCRISLTLVNFSKTKLTSVEPIHCLEPINDDSLSPISTKVCWISLQMENYYYTKFLLTMLSVATTKTALGCCLGGVFWWRLSFLVIRPTLRPQSALTSVGHTLYKTEAAVVEVKFLLIYKFYY